MPHTAFGRFSGSLNTALAPLYLIYGEEELLRLEALDALRAAAKQQGYSDRRLFSADAHADWNALFAESGSAGLFADRKLLEIHIPNGKPGKNGGEALLQLAEQPPEHTVSVVVLPKLERSQSQSKWFAALSRRAVCYEAKALTAANLPAWLRGRLHAHGLDIEADALALFAARVEGNLLAAKQEIDKLALLHPSGHILSLHDAENAVADVARFDPFQLSAAWMNGDRARLVRLLDALAAAETEPVLPLWALAEDIRTLIRLSAALKQGKSVHSVRNELKLWGVREQAAARAAARLNASRLTAALQECARIDRQIKGAEDGDAWTAFARLISALAA